LANNTLNNVRCSEHLGTTVVVLSNLDGVSVHVVGTLCCLFIHTLHYGKEYNGKGWYKWK